MQEWTVQIPERLDMFLTTVVEGLSRARAQKLIKEGVVLVNGSDTRKPAQQIRPGDTVSLVGEIREERTSALEPIDLGLTVLYEDIACMVLLKPAGIAVHPGPAMPADEKTLLNGIAFLFAERSVPFSEADVLVHRLDKDTTGCILVAKSPAARATLQAQFEKRTVTKIYLALVAGVPSPAEALIDAPVGRNLTDRTKMSVLKTSVSREARTTYHTLAAGDNVSLLACDLHTGRTHQVRVHLSSIGHPILGDRAYASPESLRLSREFIVKSLCLHAWKVTFVSPADGKEHSAQAPLPAAFQEALDEVGIENPKS